MTETTTQSKGIAGLLNVSTLVHLLMRVDERSDGMAGIGVYSGFPGWGKTFAATYCTLQRDAHLITAAPVGGNKAFCEAIKHELGLAKGGTVHDMVNEIIEALATRGRPLIIDEADTIVREGRLELLRYMHDMANVPIALIGMEQLPTKLAKFEQFHSRVVHWARPMPASVEDTEKLAPIYAPDTTIADDLVKEITQRSAGSLRRIRNNLIKANEISLSHDLSTTTLKDWGKRSFDTGEAPQARKGFK